MSYSDTMKGFTLIELLIAISIIGMLAAISIFGLQGARESGRDSKRKADIESIRSALEIYRADCGSYPANVTGGAPIDGTGSCAGNTYMEEVPFDPDGVTEYNYTNGGPTQYTICATLEQNGPVVYCVDNP